MAAAPSARSPRKELDGATEEAPEQEAQETGQHHPKVEELPRQRAPQEEAEAAGGGRGRGGGQPPADG